MRSHQSSAVMAPLAELVVNVREWCEQQTDVSSASLSRLAADLQASIDRVLTADESYRGDGLNIRQASPRQDSQGEARGSVGRH